MTFETLATATDLTRWANLQSARYKLPLVVRRLIHATVERVERIGFPADEGVQLGGWDGIVVVEIGNSFVPNGCSVWELGVNREVKGKADDDYEKRCKDSLGLDPAATTFIFVTPRRWGGKDEWMRNRQKEGIWREVRAYDADDLEQWLELAPAVHTWLSVLMGKHPAGATDITNFWADWSETTHPVLNPSLLTIGREETVNRVYDWLHEPPSVLSLQADTQEEAVAFLAAALYQLPPEQRLPYLSRTVIAGDGSTWNQLCASESALVLVSLFNVGDAVTRAVRAEHHVFAPLGRDSSASDTMLKLPRLHVAEARSALFAMGLSEERADELAPLARRSLMALRRKLAVSPEVQQPKWARPEAARSLLPALLAGTWRDTQDGDRNIIARLAHVPYEEVNAALSRWANESDPPVRRVGDTWLLVSKEDAWSLLCRYLTGDDLKRFEAVVHDVLGEIDPALELEVKYRSMAGLLGKSLTYSGLLREGLADTLALMGARNETTQWTDTVSLQERANRIVQQLLDSANRDWRIWASLTYQLPRLAEAAPRVYLRQVEEGLKGSEPVLVHLFEDSTDDIFARSSHTGLLWSLELLAWHPEYLSRAALYLAILARLDPGGRLGNRPDKSLRSIFLVWYPCTTADLENRLAVLDMLRSREPAIAWCILNRLLPELDSHAELTAKARWREWIPERQPTVTYGELRTAEREIVKRMLLDVGSSGQRWKNLIEHLDDVEKDQHEAIVDCLLAVDLSALPATDRLVIWTALRTLISRHSKFPEAKWAMPKEVVDRLLQVYNHFEPTNLVDKHSWLFASHPEIIGSLGKDWQALHKAIAQARQEAIQAIYEQGGLSSLFAFSNHVEQPGELGILLGNSTLLLDEEEVLISQSLGSACVAHNLLGRGFIRGRSQSYGWEWVENKITNITMLVRLPEQQAEFFKSLPFEEDTWNLLETMSAEVQAAYWAHIRPVMVAPHDCSKAVRNLLTYNRAHVALDLITLYLNNPEAGLSTDLITSTLEQAVKTTPERKEDWQTLIYHTDDILNRIETSRDVADSRIASLEFALLPFLDHGTRGSKVLHKELSVNPDFFIDVLSLVYKAENEEQSELTEFDATRARLAERLLRTWRKIPGTQDDGLINPQALREWVLQVREAAHANGRSKITDVTIGQVLSFAPKDEDDNWPCRPVRDLIEQIGSEELDRGFVVGVLNQRGGFTKTLTEGGAQERQLVEVYRHCAELIRDQWPRTASALEDVAENYTSQSHHSDISTELEEDLWR